MSELLLAADLAIDYGVPGRGVRGLDGARLALGPAQTLGVVGESGSGKSTLGLAIGRLLPGTARRSGGDLLVGGRSVFAGDDAEIRRLRRDELGFVFQNPMTALDPTMRVGRQVARAIGAGKPAEVEALLERAGLRELDRVVRSYPHQLSGGMAQRVAIAIAIARGPRLLVADEPTSALDATLRDQILRLLVSLRDSTGASVLLLSHELRAVARHCERVAVMYGGRVVESGESRVVFARPAHPYTRALLAAAPGRERRGERLVPIPGTPPMLTGPAMGCAFAPRCAFAEPRCARERPELRRIEGRDVLCHRAEAVIEHPPGAAELVA